MYVPEHGHAYTHKTDENAGINEAQRKRNETYAEREIELRFSEAARAILFAKRHVSAIINLL